MDGLPPFGVALDGADGDQLAGVARCDTLVGEYELAFHGDQFRDVASGLTVVWYVPCLHDSSSGSTCSFGKTGKRIAVEASLPR